MWNKEKNILLLTAWGQPEGTPARGSMLLEGKRLMCHLPLWMYVLLCTQQGPPTDSENWVTVRKYSMSLQHTCYRRKVSNC